VKILHHLALAIRRVLSFDIAHTHTHTGVQKHTDTRVYKRPHARTQEHTYRATLRAHMHTHTRLQKRTHEHTHRSTLRAHMHTHILTEVNFKMIMLHFIANMSVFQLMNSHQTAAASYDCSHTEISHVVALSHRIDTYV